MACQQLAQGYGTPVSPYPNANNPSVTQSNGTIQLQSIDQNVHCLFIVLKTSLIIVGKRDAAI